MNNKQKNRCPTCGHITDRREIAMFDGLVRALGKVFRWCLEKGRHEFTRREIKHLFSDENEVARFGDWILFGGLVYRPEGRRRGHYGINIERTAAFFAGKYRIPKRLWKDSITGKIEAEDYVTIGEMPKLADLLNKDFEYLVNYRQKELF